MAAPFISGKHRNQHSEIQAWSSSSRSSPASCSRSQVLLARPHSTTQVPRVFTARLANSHRSVAEIAVCDWRLHGPRDPCCAAVRGAQKSPHESISKASVWGDAAMRDMRPPETLAEIEREHILATLASCDGNRTRAAEVLGISIRCLRNKLHLYSDEGAKVPEPPRGVRTA